MLDFRTLSIAGVFWAAVTGSALATETSMACGPEDSPILQDYVEAIENNYDRSMGSIGDDGESFRVYSHKDPNSDQKAVITRFANGQVCLTPAIK